MGIKASSRSFAILLYAVVLVLYLCLIRSDMFSFSLKINNVKLGANSVSVPVPQFCGHGSLFSVAICMEMVTA